MSLAVQSFETLSGWGAALPFLAPARTDAWLVGWSPDERSRFCDVVALADEVLGTRDRVALVVHDRAQPWWDPKVVGVPTQNPAEQPIDRGSAPGVLLAVLRALRRDPRAVLVLVPSGAGFDARDVHEALDVADAARVCDSGRVLVMVPRGERSSAGPERVAEAADRRLCVASASTLLRMFQRAQPELVQTFLQELAGGALFDPCALDRFYPFLPRLELGRDVLAEAEDLLERVALEPTGPAWTDDLERAHPIGRLLAQLEA